MKNIKTFEIGSHLSDKIARYARDVTVEDLVQIVGGTVTDDSSEIARDIWSEYLHGTEDDKRFLAFYCEEYLGHKLRVAAMKKPKEVVTHE